jgi:CheY-like chemotaxis protein/HPt (histidine-containing phosphotransfer) domain-containing protein
LEGLRVLVVDDNETNRRILREMLTARGSNVKEADNGHAAMVALKSSREKGQPYDLVLLDHRMPGMDGFQVAEAVQHTPDIAGTTVMMLTSDNRTGDVARCRDLGIMAYLIKPVRRNELEGAIATAIGAARPTMEEGPEKEIHPPEADFPPLKILLAEDADENRFVIQAYLNKTPYEIDTAENGANAVEKFESGGYDLVLMDMQMPVMDGYSATQAIRAWERENHRKPVPIIALTAYALKEDVQRSFDVGCDGHLSKPVKKSQLIKTILDHTGGAAVVSGDVETRREETIVIKADPDIADMIPWYLTKVAEDVKAVTEALDKKDFETIRVAGHRLKGSGANYGFADLSEMGHQLEQAAEAEDRGRIEWCLKKISVYLDRVEVVYG